MPKYRASEYLRLSYSDDKNNESDSVANQKRLIADYLSGHPEIELVSTRVDDGYSRVLFDRPEFQKMMEEIMAGKVNCVIVKDLSRLGREYIETGRYLRQIFPTYGVRFISINDGIDTANEHSGDDLTVGLKNIMNDSYCHDISVKTRSALQVKRKNGDYVGACPIYGYQKSPENHNQLIVDRDPAAVVKEIFRQRINGVSAQKIAASLNDRGILSPLAYKISHGLPHPKRGYTDSADAKWAAHTVIRILQDETYTGTLVQGKQGTHNHKVKNLIQFPSSEWIRFEGAHEAIISKRDYDLVQRIMRLDTRTAPNGEGVYLFSGMVICGCCGSCMTRKILRRGDKAYIYYYCRTGKKNGCTNPVMIREDELEQCVLAAVQAHVQSVVTLSELLDSRNEEQINRDAIASCKAQIAENEAKLEKANSIKATLYESFIDGVISKAEYGIRFISVNEGFDSKNHPGETGGLNVAFMYLLAEFYSRDLSVKSKSAKLIKMNKGEYQSKQCLYGYQKGADGRLEPDPETAPVIRLIFDLALEGKTSTQISKVLLERGICTPGEYRALKEHKKYDISRCCGIWQSSSIGRIVSDERYAGTYIIGKRRVTEVGSTHVRLKDESEWIKIPDHHPALVSKEVFDQVQKTYRRYTSPNHRPRDYVLRGKVYCGCCRHAMTYHHAVKEFCCRYTRASEKAPCFHLTIPEQELEVMLYQMIEQQAQLILNVDNLNVIGSLEMNSAKLLELEKEVDSLKEKKVRLYEQMLTHELSLIEYKRKKAGIDGTLSHLEETAASLRTEINEMQMGEKEKEARVKLAHEISDAGKLTTELTGVLIERVFVFPRNEIEVIWKVKDFFS